jgi:hypothetical protein
MRNIGVLLIGAAALAFASPASAREYPWCAQYGGRDGDGGTNCGFDTLQQCRDTIFGIGGICRPNPFYYDQVPRAEVRKKRRQPRD